MNTLPNIRPVTIQPGRRLLLGLALLTAHILLPTEVGAQTSVPLLVNYQGTVTDSTGTPLGNTTPTNRKVLFRLWDANTGGTRLWTEEQTVTISQGQFSVLLGLGINATGTAAGESRPALDTIFTGTGNDRYLGVTVDNGDNSITGSDTEITPRQRITSVAYSLRARAADSVASTTDLMLGGSANYGLGWYGTGRLFNAVNVNGPVVYGQGGGILGAVNGATQTPVLRWNELGQVGIGTTAMPSGSELTLQGDDTNAPPLHLNIRGATDTNKRLLIGYHTSSNYGAIQAYSAASTTTSLLLNQAGGNVGIGTSAPNSRLTVGTPINGAGFLPGINIGSATGDSIFAAGQSDSRSLVMKWVYNASAANAYGMIETYGAANPLILQANLLILQPTSGNVGIGNTSPTARLDVTGGIKATGDGGYTFNTGDADGGIFSPADGVVTLLSNGTERLRADANGNVGIGTTTINHRLQVYGNLMVGTGAPSLSFTPIGDTLYLGQPRKYLSTTLGTAVGGSVDWLNLMCHSGSAGILFGGATTDATPHSSPDVYMAIKPSGNVGIGTTTPAAKLHVKAAVDNSIAAGIKLEHAGDTSGWFIWPENANDNLLFMFNSQYPSGVYTLLSKNSSGFITVSDERIKKDIEFISGSLGRVMKLQPKTYRFKSAAADTPLNYGFIAQEVEKVYPDLVGENLGQKTLAINSLIAINTQAIQELKMEKDAEVKRLKAENLDLEARVKALEAAAKARDEADKAIAMKLATLEKLLRFSEKPAAQPVSLKRSAGGAE